ncbi:NAD(P)-binding protein [Podospora australis]|uniref:NAD(P)-binding protein n=1 Tax=Podospora australis TaxID=1536484 RepID=A0AAN7AIU3_9PEZI|nr:NAD(P)-binding protein [Podospora australis]
MFNTNRLNTSISQPHQESLTMAPSTYRKLQDEHVLIIGGSSGIGYAVADGALASGAKVTICSSSQAKIDAAVARLRSEYPEHSIHGVSQDLSVEATIESDIESLFEKVQATQGTINHVVFTAASPLSLGAIENISADLIRAAGHMRLVVPFLVAKIAANHLPKTNNSSIVLTSGSVSERPTPGWSLMSYFGGGLSSVAKGLAVDLAPTRVNVVRPGFVDTPLWTEEQKAFMAKIVEEKTLTGKGGTAEDVAEAYLWLLKDRNVTGTAAATDSGALLV